MAIGITVRYYVSIKKEQLFCYALRATVTSATDMPEEIFVFQRNVAPAETKNEQPSDQFVCIADPVDLQEIPVSAPDLQNEMPYYRVSQVDLLFRSMDDLKSTKDLIAQDIQLLVDSLKAAGELEVMSEEHYA